MLLEMTVEGSVVFQCNKLKEVPAL